MARIRTVKPELFLNEQLAELPFQYRLLFIGLFNQADRSGRLLDRPKRLKAEIFPYDNVDVDKGLNALQESGFILRYKSDGENSASVIQVLTFEKHQKIDKTNEKESILPPPLPLDYDKTIDRLVIDGEGKGTEGNRKGTEGMPSAVESYETFISDFNSLMGKKYTGDKKSKEHFAARIKEGFTGHDFINAIKNAMQDKWQQENSFKYLTPEYITRSDQLQKWMNFQKFEVISGTKPLTENEKQRLRFQQLKETNNDKLAANDNI